MFLESFRKTKTTSPQRFSTTRELQKLIPVLRRPTWAWVLPSSLSKSLPKPFRHWKNTRNSRLIALRGTTSWRSHTTARDARMTPIAKRHYSGKQQKISNRLNGVFPKVWSISSLISEKLYLSSAIGRNEPGSGYAFRSPCICRVQGASPTAQLHLTAHLASNNWSGLVADEGHSQQR